MRKDAVIERDGEASYLLTRLHASNAELGPTHARIVLSANTDHLVNGVYHRYDGHYGLIVPA
jgi:hypothetical protein